MAVLNEALADELQRQGVTRVFTLLGEDVVQLGVCLTQRGIELVSAHATSQARSRWPTATRGSPASSRSP